MAFSPDGSTLFGGRDSLHIISQIDATTTSIGNIITQNGEAKAAIMNIREFEQLQETIAMLKLIAQGKKSMAAKRFRPAEDVLRDF